MFQPRGAAHRAPDRGCRASLAVMQASGSAAAGRIADIGRRIDDGPFTVSRDVDLGGGTTASLVASRTTFSWKGLAVLSQHLVIQHVARPTPADVQSLLRRSFAVARKRNSVPLLRGMQFGFMVVAILVADQVDQEVLDLVSVAPPRRWGLFQLPVICEAATGNAHFYRGTPLWGGFFFSDLRAVIARYVSASR
jgi:hypothetical protein